MRMTIIRSRPATALSLLVAALLAATLAPSRAGAQTTYISPDGRYIVEAPEGFSRLSAESVDPMFDVAFTKPLESDPEFAINVVVQPLGDELPRERFRREHLDELYATTPGATNADISSLSWRGYELNVVEFTLGRSDGPVFIIAAQVPIRDDAIQVMVSAPVTEPEAARAVLAQTVAGVDGEIRWALPPAPPVSPQSSRRSAGASTALIVLAAVIFVGGLISAFEIRRRTARGVLLVAAIIVLILGAGQAASAEAASNMLIGGTLQLLGVIAAIIGVVDLFLPRRKKIPVAKRATQPAPTSPPAQPDTQ